MQSRVVIKRTVLVWGAIVVVVVLAVLAVVLLTMALAVVRDARRLLHDQLTRDGNRLFRLSQRLNDALARLDATLRICLKEQG